MTENRLFQSGFSGLSQARLFGQAVPIEAIENRPTLENRARILCVASGKGGTGKSFFSATLSHQIAKEGKQTLLLDADFGLSDAHLYLGIRPEKDISYLLNGHQNNDSVIAHGADNVDYIYSGSGLANLAALEQMQWSKLLKALAYFEQRYSHIVIDLGAGIGPQVLPYLMCSDEIVLVTNPDSPALLDAFATLKILSHKQYQGAVYLVVNRTMFQKGEKAAHILKKGVEKLNPLFHFEYVGSISESRGLSVALKQKKSLLDLYPYDPGSLDLKKIVKHLLEKETDMASTTRKEMSYFLRVKKYGDKS